MLHQNSETKSLITSKKEELFDQLLNSIEEENLGPGDSPGDRVFWIILTYYARDTWEQPRPITVFPHQNCVVGQTDNIPFLKHFSDRAFSFLAGVLVNDVEHLHNGFL